MVIHRYRGGKWGYVTLFSRKTGHFVVQGRITQTNLDFNFWTRDQDTAKAYADRQITNLRNTRHLAIRGEGA